WSQLLGSQNDMATIRLGDADGRWDADDAVLDRLAALRRDAEAAGWTSLALERDGPGEHFRLFGVPPGGALRAEVAGDVSPD
ncbi:hypothetical protein, partial [Roseisolibacter sp. H3M3-2]|uniref:hypothetical protein n=1 Tax=Roseisolibacter sp. H3M3-2 TaxID=3031323 RepID=UPI0023DA98E6